MRRDRRRGAGSATADTRRIDGTVSGLPLPGPAIIPIGWRGERVDTDNDWCRPPVWSVPGLSGDPNKYEVLLVGEMGGLQIKLETGE